jgi:hypothetical protein
VAGARGLSTAAALVAVLGAVALIVVAGPAAAKGGRPPTVVSAQCHGHNFKPGRIILACGDAGLLVEHLTWKHWGRREANGVGTGVGKTCEPDCAAGGTKSAGMEVRLFRAERCEQDHRVHFTRIRYRWTHGSPIAGQPDQAVIPSPCRAV